MPVVVAEYLGQRTDVDEVEIQPVEEGSEVQCPFMAGYCSKVKKKLKPVCSVRKTDGTVWITCQHRLCATMKGPLTNYQSGVLLDIARTVFHTSVKTHEVCVRREVRMAVNDGTDYNADYIMTLSSGRSPYPGPDRFVLEMQGGGETSQTGKITAHIALWEKAPLRTNELLRQPVPAGTIETNAWRRQQEQFIVKGNISMKTWKGYGIVFCVGAPLFDYLKNKLVDAKLPDLRSYNWTLALVGFSEVNDGEQQSGPVPYKVDRERLLFTNYQTFVQALINQGEPSLDAFSGTFMTLDGGLVQIPRDGVVEGRI
ncbi:restriction endonuclease [Paenibacillus sp. EKM208P]|nr:restriction endonuclease [Paenibacillus sp. EKM208P]